MATLFGAPYARGGRALAVLAVGFAIDGSAGCYNTLLAMIGRPWLVFMNGFVGGVSAVGLCLLLIPRYGMVGAAAAVTIARSAATALGTFEIWQLHGFHPFSRSSLKLLAAGLSAGSWISLPAAPQSKYDTELDGSWSRGGTDCGYLHPGSTDDPLLD